MSIKEFAKQRLFDFFVITTCTNFAIFILGSIYNHGMTFSYEVLLLPPLYGLFGTIPSWILYSKNELTLRQMVVRKILQTTCLEILLILITFTGDHLCMENLPVIISFAVSVLVVSLCVNLVTWILEKRQANLLMEDLANYQKEKRND